LRVPYRGPDEDKQEEGSNPQSGIVFAYGHKIAGFSGEFGKPEIEF